MGGVHPDASLTTAKSTSTESMAAMNAANGNPTDTSLPAPMDADKQSTPAAIDAGKGANPGHSLVTDVGAAKESTPAAIDADKGSNPGDSLVTDVGGAKETTPAAIDADKGANPGDSLVTDVGGAKESTSAAIDAAKGANSSDPLATDVDAAKVANTDHPLATLVDAGANIDNIDNSTVNLLVAASPPIPDIATAQPPPKFDIEKAKSLIAQKDWEGLDVQLCKFVDDITGKKLQDPAIFHPGLLLIAREQKIVQLLEDEEFEVAITYADKFLKPLKTCESNFKPLNLKVYIDDIIRMIDDRSSRKSIVNADVETAILDYLLLYFRAMCQNEAGHEVEGTWQFARKLPSTDNEASSAKSQKNRQAFRCLACGWTVRGSASISSLRYHITHARNLKVYPCPKVSQDMLDRMKVIDDSSSALNLSDFVASVKNKRKRSSSLSATDQKTKCSSSATEQSLQTPSVAVGPVKKLRSSSADSHTVASSPPAGGPVANPSFHGVDEGFILEKVDILQKISTFIIANKDSVVPSARSEYLQKARELEKVAFDLKMKTAEAGSDTVANPSYHGVEEGFILEKVDILQKISTFIITNKDLVVPSARSEYLQKARELEKVAFDLKMKTAEAGSDMNDSAPPSVQMPPQTQETSG